MSLTAHPRLRRSLVATTAVFTASGLLLTGCAGGSGGGSADESTLTIGASLPLTGSLQEFGTSLQTGYEAAIDEVNAAGGLTVGDTAYEVELVLQDNASDADKAAEQARSLVLDSGASALLGPATPPLTVAVSSVADQLQVPLISTITPVQSWLSGSEEGYEYAWDVFFDEEQMTETAFQAAELVDTDKKVAIFTDTEENLVQANLWAQHAETYGYEVVSRAEFPAGNTNFSTQVGGAKAAGADIVLANLIPPDAVALLKEMKSQAYAPALAVIEKAGNTGGFVEITGGLAEGVLASNWFAEGMGLDRESEFIEKYRETAGGINSNIGTIAYGYSIASVLLDAFEAAGSTEASAVNAAIASTDSETPAGRIVFAEDHAARLKVVQTQWTGVDQVLVTTVDGKAANPISVPVTGLQ